MGPTSTSSSPNQLPVLPPETYDEPAPWEHAIALAQWLTPRALELTYTAWEMEGFAADLGYHGPPFRWDDERRALLRAELDACFFHLYGIERPDVDYILGTFPIVERKDRARHGEYRTKRLILERYDALAAATSTATPYAPSSTRSRRPRHRPPRLHPPTLEHQMLTRVGKLEMGFVSDQEPRCRTSGDACDDGSLVLNARLTPEQGASLATSHVGDDLCARPWMRPKGLWTTVPRGRCPQVPMSTPTPSAEPTPWLRWPGDSWPAGPKPVGVVIVICSGPRRCRDPGGRRRRPL